MFGGADASTSQLKGFFSQQFRLSAKADPAQIMGILSSLKSEEKECIIIIPTKDCPSDRHATIQQA